MDPPAGAAAEDLVVVPDGAECFAIIGAARDGLAGDVPTR